MADYSSNNNGGANVNSVNSNSIALFANDGTMLRVSFKNEQMILTITPRMSDESGKFKWPRELSHSAMLRPQVCAALYDGFVDKILPKIKENVDYEGYGSVPLNRDCTNLCGFGYAGGRATFAIFNNVGSDRTCNEVYTFMFDTTPFIDKYNPNTGAYDVTDIQGQLFVIVYALQMAAKHLSGVVGHSAKVAASYSTNQIISHCRAIAAKLGATPAQYGNFNGFQGSPDSPNFGGGQGGGSGSTTWSTGFQEGSAASHGTHTDVQQVSSLESLMGAPAPVPMSAPASQDETPF